MAYQQPIELPEVDETTGRGRRIRQAEKNFGMTCIDTMGRQADYGGQRPTRNRTVELDEFEKRFANQGNQ